MFNYCRVKWCRTSWKKLCNPTANYPRKSITTTAMMKRVPIVVVLGATGAGKSKLALEVAQKFGGEIISADAMQMYKGLDIVTNKVSHEEQKLVKHHMIDFLDPLLKSSVVDFRNQVSLF